MIFLRFLILTLVFTSMTQARSVIAEDKKLGFALGPNIWSNSIDGLFFRASYLVFKNTDFYGSLNLLGDIHRQDSGLYSTENYLKEYSIGVKGNTSSTKDHNLYGLIGLSSITRLNKETFNHTNSFGVEYGFGGEFYITTEDQGKNDVYFFTEIKSRLFHKKARNGSSDKNFLNSNSITVGFSLKNY